MLLLTYIALAVFVLYVMVLLCMLGYTNYSCQQRCLRFVWLLLVVAFDELCCCGSAVWFVLMLCVVFGVVVVGRLVLLFAVFGIDVAVTGGLCCCGCSWLAVVVLCVVFRVGVVYVGLRWQWCCSGVWWW